MQYAGLTRYTPNCVLFSVLSLFAALALPTVVFAQQNSVLNVQVSKAKEALRPLYLRASGLVKPWDEIKVDAQIGGVPVVGAAPRVGTQVHKGELLVRFAASDANAQLALAEATLARARAVYADALMNQRRAFKLRKAGMLSAQNILDVATRTAVAQAEVTAATAQLKIAALNLSHTRVLAPFSGVISTRSVKLGEVLQPGAPLYKIIRKGALQWQAELTADQLARVRPGMSALIDAAKTTVVGTVSSLSPSLDSATQTGLAYVALEPSPAVRAGMYITGKIALAVRHVILAPSQSIVTRNGRSYAVAFKRGHAVFMPVVLGSRGTQTTEVLKGLSAGTELITQGAGLLDNGAPVTLVH